MAGAGDVAFLKGGGDGADRQISPVQVDRALSDGDVIEWGPLTVQTYSILGHTPGSTSFSFLVQDGNRDYKAAYYCCGQRVPENVGNGSNYSEAVVRHNSETFRKMLPVDIYLSGTSYTWAMTERLARLKAGEEFAFVDRSIFPAFFSALEVDFAEKFRGQ